jgi:L-lactate dehydrogenase complex protein LldG
MSEESSREMIVAAARRAVSAWQEEMPAALVRSPAPPRSAALLERFIARAEAADAFVSIAADLAGALQRVADILFELEARQVIVSDDVWRAPWDIARLTDVIEEGTIRPTSSLHDTSPQAIAGFAYVGITGAVCAVAETGTVVVASGPAGGRIESLLPPVHVVLLMVSQIVAGLPEAFERLQRGDLFERSSALTFITGPSRTADIELTLTIGVHGPKQLFVILVNDTPAGATTMAAE